MLKFTKIVFLFLSLSLVACSSLTQDDMNTSADLVVINAKVITLDASNQQAQAVAIRSGKFIKVGSNNEIQALINKETKIIDAKGKTLIPGLNDAHIHMVRAGMYWKYEVRLDEATSISEILQLIGERSQKTPKGTWILTLGGWHPSQIKERRMPTLEELDRVAPNHPVYIQALRDMGQMNSAAIKASKITANSELPGGVTIGKDASGNFNGLIKGFNGQVLALKAFPTPSFEEKVAGLQLVMQDFNQAGLTSVGETFGIGVNEGDYQVLFEAWRRKMMSLRVGLHFPTINHDDAKKWIKSAASSSSDDMLLFNGLGEGVLNSVGDGYLPKQFPINNEAKE